ncbi:MAG: TetR/AcrR family transcriptional regulator [Desulfatiglandaceae bacterium]
MSKPKSLQKSKKIQNVVAHLFARKGYHSTSMRAIAREVGMNQSSLYHYFKSKENILFKLMNDAVDDALATLNEICAADLSPQEKLNEVLGFYTRYYAGDQERLIILINEINSLSESNRRILVKKQRQYVHLLRSIINELAADNKIMEVDSTVATFAFFGMVHYTVKWYRKEGAIGLDELADSFSQILTRGILR